MNVMQSLSRLLAAGAAAVLLFDLVGSILSKALAFEYGALILGSTIIYGTFGFVAAARGGVKLSIFIGAFLGFVDSTAGWGLSWLIGPGRPAEGFTGLGPLVTTSLAIVLLASVTAAVGGIIRRALLRRGNVAA